MNLKRGCFVILICTLSSILINAQPSNQLQNPASAATEYRVGVAYNSSLMSVNDKFEFQLSGGEKIVLDSEHKVVYFSKKFTTGEAYSVTQVSGIRTCPLTYVGGNHTSIAEGVISNNEVLINAECGPPQLSIGKLNLTGVETGETFKFADKYGRTISLPFSTVANLGGYPVGDPFLLTQMEGPRQCVITYPSSSVPNEPFTIQADCRRNPPPSNTKLNGQFIAPAGTKIVLRLNNTDTLIITQQSGAGNTWLQTKDFNFPKSYMTGTPYSVTIKYAPANLGCIIYENAAGNISENGPVVRVRCDKTYDLVSRSTDNKIHSTYYESFNPVIGGTGEDEGRYVAFGAYGKGMDGSTGNYRQIFWRDRKTGETKLISKSTNGEESNGNCQMAAISSDGKTVAFESYATNLTGSDKNGARDIYVWQQSTGKVSLISKALTGEAANSESMEPTISGNGNVIAYSSGAGNITKGVDGTSTVNVYIHSLLTGTTELLTKDYQTGKGVGGSAPSISDDGTKVAFYSFSYKLTPNDINNLWDIFLWQSGMPDLKRISLTSSGGERNQGTESSSRVVSPALSGDGRFIAYATTATNMIPGDNNGMQDIFLYNIATRNVKRISTVNNNTEGDGDSPIGQGEKAGISYDGSWVTYNTTSSNLGVPKGNIVMQNTRTGKIVPITNTTAGSTGRPLLSKYGGYVIAGCSEKYDIRYPSSGIFAFHTGNTINNQ